MKCPECVKEERRSRVYFAYQTTTALYYTPHYDEDGNFVPTAQPPLSTTYDCSNGHRWTEVLEPPSEVQECSKKTGACETEQHVLTIDQIPSGCHGHGCGPDCDGHSK